MRAQVRKAFTLVEILIVVVILGILAAIVVPQFTNATQDAQAGNLSAQLDTLNNQLELYKARNQGTNPLDLQTGGQPVTPSATPPVWGPWDTMIAGGYLKGPPRNPACPKTGTINTPTYGDNQFECVPGNAGVANVGWNFADKYPDVGNLPDTIEAAYYDELQQKVQTLP